MSLYCPGLLPIILPMGQLLFKRNHIKVLHKITACVEKSFKKFTVPGLHFSLRTVFSRLPVSKIMGWYPLVEDTKKLQWAYWRCSLLLCIGSFAPNLRKTAEVHCELSQESWAAGGGIQWNMRWQEKWHGAWVQDGQVKRYWINQQGWGWTWTVWMEFGCRGWMYWVG